MSELKEAFREAARREFAMVPPEAELHWVFSPRFERKMRRLIHAQEHGYWNLINTAAKRAAIVAAILVLLLTSVMAIKPVRQRVIQFFVDVYEEYFEIRFGEEEKDDIDPTPQPMVRYTLTELPEGYEEVEYIDSEHFLWTCWKNKDGRGIYLKQELGTQEIKLDSNQAQQLIIEHSEIKLICYKYNGSASYIWEQDNYLFSLTVHEYLQEEQILSMIDSLKEFS